MKRGYEEMDTSATEEFSNESSTSDSKRLKEANEQQVDVNLLGSDHDTLLNVWNQFIGPAVGQPQPLHTFVERNPNPGGYSLVNPNYVGKKSLQELDAGIGQASQCVAANMRSRVNEVGLQMKFLHERLQKTYKDILRDGSLHMAACNFVKKPRQTYHLYERPSGQKYFSMLSPQDWDDKAPHKFLGSWFLEADQSWTPAEEKHFEYEGAAFLQKLYPSSMMNTEQLK